MHIITKWGLVVKEFRFNKSSQDETFAVNMGYVAAVLSGGSRVNELCLCRFDTILFNLPNNVKYLETIQKCYNDDIHIHDKNVKRKERKVLNSEESAKV